MAEPGSPQSISQAVGGICNHSDEKDGGFLFTLNANDLGLSDPVRQYLSMVRPASQPWSFFRSFLLVLAPHGMAQAWS